jgi:arylsulfatase A-like enzyme
MPERMVRQGDWKYMHAEGDACQLYNLAEDPHETRNRIDDPACRNTVRRLRELVLDGWEQPDMTAVPHGGIWNDIDPRTHQRLMQEWQRTRRRVRYPDA